MVFVKSVNVSRCAKSHTFGIKIVVLTIIISFVSENDEILASYYLTEL